jgi:hypothetical protein
VAVFSGFFIREVLSKSLPRPTDPTPAIKGNLKIYQKITGKEERPRLPRIHMLRGAAFLSRNIQDFILGIGNHRISCFSP